MIVEDLVFELNQLPQDAMVVIEDRQGRAFRITSITRTDDPLYFPKGDSPSEERFVILTME
jgi:hypothetical protein